MTVKEACAHNNRFSLKSTFKEQIPYDKKRKRWIVDPEGRIGYVHACRHDAFIIVYPVRCHNKTFRCECAQFSLEKWSKFTPLSK